MYGQAQANAVYTAATGARSKALQDPFTAMPTYAQRFVKEERALPDWSRRPVCRELFPKELLEVIEPEDSSGPRKRRKLELTRVNALPNAEEAFGLVNGEYYEGEDGAYFEDQPQASAASQKLLLERLDAMDGEEAGEDVGDDDAEAVEEEEDMAYDDEDAGDYDAENYFDNGDDGGDDYGDDGDGEGTY
jgi:DNA-directed RNA polymerase III subunit RPC7